MPFTEKKHTNAQEREKLHDLNVKYTECLAEKFLPEFFAGRQVRVEHFCLEERDKMYALD